MGEKKRLWGLAIGLLGAAMTGWFIYTLLSSAGCVGGTLNPDCPEPSVTPALALPLGIILAMAGMFMGGGFLIFSALFIAIGAAALAVGVLDQMPEMPSFPWLFGGLFVLGGLAPLLGGLVLRRRVAVKQVMAADLMRSGVRGIGTIVEVRDTGMTLNDNPRVTLRMRIDPDDGSAPVERSKSFFASRVAIPRAGDRFPAWFDRADPDKWMFGTDMDATAPAEVKEMFARARAGASAPSGMVPMAGGPVEELASLTELWKQGALTDAEFAEAKARLLAQIGR
jgi:membrane protein implicated in regulation of membrane protease activity